MKPVTASRLPWHILPLLAILAMAGQAIAADTVWVRIDHDATHPAVQAATRVAPLQDYGSFQWGPMPESLARNLKHENIRISIQANPFVLNLGGERFDPTQRSPAELTYRAEPGGDFHLIQFDGPIRAEWFQALIETGVQVVQPLHPYSFVVWADSSRINAARALKPVRFAGPMQPEWKRQTSRPSAGSLRTPAMALISAHADPFDIRRRLEQFDELLTVAPYNRHFRIVHMNVAPDDHQRISEIVGVYTVQQILPEAGLRGEMSNQSITGGIDGAGDIVPGYGDWLATTGFDGSGILIGVVDSGIRESHQDLIGNTAPCVASGEVPTSCTTANSNHGTHVAGAIAGHAASNTTNSAGFLRGQGVAPGAHVIQQRFGSFLDSSNADDGYMRPDGMLKIFRESALSGALLTNNSWGPTGTPQGYDIPTQQVDFIARDADPSSPGQQPVLPVWAIMNGSGDSDGNCAPSSLGSPDEAKNLLAVGSTSLQTSGGAQVSNIFRISSNSAHGPACDGRRVPHIVAPGCRTDNICSGSGTCTSDSAYGLACGTSMAAPVVSGAIAVWAQHYIDQHGIPPSPALAKAVFTAAAQDLAGNPDADGFSMGHRPDRFQGYGRVDLEFVMNPGLEVFMFDQAHVFTQSGQDWQLELNAADPDAPIRIMLAWTDAPGHGLGGETPAWVNNLDLVVETGSGSYLGNVIGDDGWSTTGGDPDDRNNLEAVYLDPTQHGGSMTLKVLAADIAGDALDPWNPILPSQDFALACYNCVPAGSGFTLEVKPDRLTACIPPSGTVEVDAIIEIGFIGSPGDPVGLTTAGAPGGVTTGIDADPVSPPDQATWAWTVDSSAQAGQSTVSLTADDGSTSLQRLVSLTLGEMPGIPDLLEPQNGTIGIDLQPTFDWQSVDEALSYRFQLATDENFTQLLIDEENLTVATLALLEPLQSNTPFYWRVQATYSCGAGQWSEVGTFATRVDPRLELSASSLEHVVPEGESDALSIEIANIGTGLLEWLVMSVEPQDAGGSELLSNCAASLPQPDWIAISPEQGMIEAQDSQTVTVTLDAGNLAPGDHLTYICFESNDLETPIVGLAVTLRVSALFSDRFEQ